MKNQIIAFILLITYSLCTVTITTVNQGTCANSVYTFTLTGTTDAALGATQTATVTLSSPPSTTPTCTVASEDPAAPAVGDRRLAAGDVTITCTISSALSSATITVSEVKVNNAAATITNLAQMSQAATCGGSSSGSGSGSNEAEEDSGKFIQLSGFLFMIILFAF